MSARVLNPAMMTEMSRNLGGGGSGRTAPSKAALARVRRDLFGPVDHAAARALAERELKAQALLDTERWGFDFHLEIPKSNSRYEWEPITANDIVPEPYALRGMPYLRKHAPGTPRKQQLLQVQRSPRSEEANHFDNGISISVDPLCIAATTTSNGVAAVNRDCKSNSRIRSTANITSATAVANTTVISTVAAAVGAMPPHVAAMATTAAAVSTVDEEDSSAERTPPQRERSRVPEIGETTPNVASSFDDENIVGRKKKSYVVEPTTPILTANARKQRSITDFMKTRKRTLNGGTKSMIEPPEKVARNTGQIRS